MIKINGDYLEGGGQILRTSLSLSAILGKEFEISNIRSKRKKPGLQPQHLTAVRAIAKICGAGVKGAELHSTELNFHPTAIKGGKYIFDVSEVKESAGSVSLIFQTVALPLAFSGTDSHLILRGGTHVNWSPCFEYLDEIFLPTVERMGFECELQINRYGYYPIGGGGIEARIGKIDKLKGLQIGNGENAENQLDGNRGKLLKIEGVSVVSNLPEDIAKRQKEEALKMLVNFNCDKKIEVKNAASPGKGTMLFLKAVHQNSVAGFFSLGEIGKKAETVGKEAAVRLLEFERSGASVDEHLADQILLFAALAEGKTEFTAAKITNHLKTNAYTIKQFLPDVKIEMDEKNRLVRVEGTGIGINSP
ncbi:MAG: RNA 3'-terminal phosphate cyclase [Candidatus Micrarchaeota archaeon]